MPAASPDSSEAGEAGAEERDGRRLRHCGCKFGYHDLAVAGPEIGDQDRVCARVERAAATARTNPAEATADRGATAAIAPTAPGAAGETPTPPTPANPTV